MQLKKLSDYMWTCGIFNKSIHIKVDKLPINLTIVKREVEENHWVACQW